MSLEGGGERPENKPPGPATSEGGWRTLALPHDLITVAVGFTVALAAFTLLEASVTNLILPLIAVFVGESPFELNQFTIRGSDFRYGAVIGAAILFGLSLTAAYFLVVVPYRRSRAPESFESRR
jgi:large conductance mechanosensitive channel